MLPTFLATQRLQLPKLDDKEAFKKSASISRNKNTYTIHTFTYTVYTHLIHIHATYIGHLFLFNNARTSSGCMFAAIDFRILRIIRIAAITLWIVGYLSTRFVSRWKSQSSRDHEQRRIQWGRTSRTVCRVWSWRSKSSGHTLCAWELVPYLHRANFHPPTVRH